MWNMTAKSLVVTASVLLAACLAIAPLFDRRGLIGGDTPVDRGCVICEDDRQFLRHGDIIFRKGIDALSEAIVRVDRHSPYSHVGIVVQKSDGLFVVHAAPADESGGIAFVKAEPLELFSGAKRAVKIGVFRLKGAAVRGAPMIAARAANEAWRIAQEHIPFDDKFDLSATDKFYCTELVWHVFRVAGVDIAAKPDVMPVSLVFGNFIFPSMLQHSLYLEEIFQRG